MLLCYDAPMTTLLIRMCMLAQVWHAVLGAPCDAAVDDLQSRNTPSPQSVRPVGAPRVCEAACGGDVLPCCRKTMVMYSLSIAFIVFITTAVNMEVRHGCIDLHIVASHRCRATDPILGIRGTPEHGGEVGGRVRGSGATLDGVCLLHSTALQGRCARAFMADSCLW